MNKVIISILMAVGLMFSTTGSFTAEEHKAKGTETKQQSGQANGSEVTKEDYEKEIEAKLDELGKDIDKLGDKADELGGEAETEIDQAIDKADLEEKREAAENKLEELKSASAETWEDVKPEVDKAVDEFENAYQQVASYFKDR